VAQGTPCGQGVVLGRSEQAQRVPTAPPGVRHLLGRGQRHQHRYDGRDRHRGDRHANARRPARSVAHPRSSHAESRGLIVPAHGPDRELAPHGSDTAVEQPCTASSRLAGNARSHRVRVVLARYTLGLDHDLPGCRRCPLWPVPWISATWQNRRVANAVPCQVWACCRTTRQGDDAVPSDERGQIRPAVRVRGSASTSGEPPGRAA
jgi:hypothetical protein